MGLWGLIRCWWATTSQGRTGGVCTALNWPSPQRILDLYAKFSVYTCGRAVPCGHSLLGRPGLFWTQRHYGGPQRAHATPFSNRGGPYTDQERQALTYCQSDVDALAQLLPVMLPFIDLPRALLRGRYCRRARKWNGQVYPSIRDAGSASRPLGDDPSPYRAPGQPALSGVRPDGLRLDPRRASVPPSSRRPQHAAMDRIPLPQWRIIWRETRLLYQDSLDARREARTRTGLTRPALPIGKTQVTMRPPGHDSMRWLRSWRTNYRPWVWGHHRSVGLRGTALAVAPRPDDHLLPRDDPLMLAYAADLVQATPEGEAWAWIAVVLRAAV